jgi:MYXO-CTERM domain-containing protein
MKTFRALALTLGLSLSGAALAPAVADACGGCFAPPGAAQVVTDHRMVLSLSERQTVLWDQFRYTGAPEEFSWILPIRYSDATRVELGNDNFLQLLDNLGVAALRSPAPPGLPPGCAPPPAPEQDFAGFADAAAPTSDPGVTVLRQEVVGPYAVAIVRGATGMGLRDWLRMNGYTVPAALEPVIDFYLSLNMDFVALRLRPGKGLNRMVPVRVVTPGYAPTLPLRMIAAGIADTVGLTLTVLAPSRVEAMNFPNLELADGDFVYDWAAPPGDLGAEFVRVYAARNRAMGSRVWVTESSMAQDEGTLRGLARTFDFQRGARPGGGGMMPVNTTDDDVRLALEGLGARATVTRLRAELAPAALDRDLQIAASDRGPRDRFYTFGRELNRPAYLACPWSDPERFGGCAVAPGSDGSGFAPLALGVALASLVRRRRGRSHSSEKSVRPVIAAG